MKIYRQLPVACLGFVIQIINSICQRPTMNLKTTDPCD